MKKTSEKIPCVSVLVPIYNVEKYLRQCLTSLHKQTLKEIEFICINDGSKDGSLEIIKEFVGLDERFRLIDKENSGYGDSMNLGLKRARGKYIGIVESDDWIDAKAFEDLYRMAEENEVEVVRANYFENKGGQDLKIRSIPIHETDRVIDPRHHSWVFLVAPAIWASIYRRDFLKKNQIEFLPTPGASYQDTGFAFKVWAAARRVWLTTNAYLHYRIDNENSSVNSLGKMFCVCDEYAEIERYLNEKGAFEDLGTIMWIGKMSTYYWKALRTDPKLLKEFLERITPEIKTATERGITFVDYFDDGVNKSAMARTIRALSKGDIGTARRIIKKDQRVGQRMERKRTNKARPYRTKAYTLERLALKLEAQNELLEQQIRDLRAKMEPDHVEKG